MDNLINRATLDVFARKIFEQLDTSDLVRCREASRSWMNFIDGENLITDESRIVEEYFKDPFIFYQSKYGGQVMPPPLPESQVKTPPYIRTKVK